MTSLIFPSQHALLTLFLALILPMQEFIRVPNDRTGVGAAGKIGRGTSLGEQFIPRAMPTQAAPAWAYYPPPSTPVQAASAWASAAPPASVEPSPAPPNNNPAEGANRDQIRRVEIPINLPALARSNPYLAYHRGWVNGFWNARVPGPGPRPAPAPAGSEAASRRGPRAIPGMGLGWSLPAWLIGPMAYRWGYFPYDNPFARPGPPAGTERPIDDYSRPIRILNPVPTEKLLDEALATFRAARDAFRREDYPRALDRTDAALRLMPDDPVIHQFGALVLFALPRYEESAAALYAVLAVGPGWDWATMIDLYGDREAYTRQLRPLEGYSEDNPQSAAARFVRAYHYFTTGYAEEALGQWDHVVALRPHNRLSAQLILELQPSGQSIGDRDALAASVAMSSATAAGSSNQPGKPEGTWIALPRPDTTIAVTFQPRGHVVWKVRQPGRDRGFEGYSLYEKSTLILSEDQDNILVGTIQWQYESHFTFKALADRPGEPGLTFAKAP
jgi:tetratricopeptide (TPR) repeat protein